MGTNEKTLSSVRHQQATFITAYGPKRKAPLQFPPDEGRTKQSFKDECDINIIMKRYANTGVLEHVQKREGVFADVTGRDYELAMNTVAAARTAFEELPAAIRDRFNNDPAELLDFVSDPDNLEEAGELGMLTQDAMARLKAKKTPGDGAEPHSGAAAPGSAGEPPAAENPPSPAKPGGTGGGQAPRK